MDRWLHGQRCDRTGVLKHQWYIWVVDIWEFTVKFSQLFYVLENYHNKTMP